MVARALKWLGLVSGLSVTAAAAAIAYGRFGTPQAVPMPPAVSGERRVIHRRAGPLSYYVSGAGAPLLLIHSINAAGSAYEVRPLAEALQSDRRVYVVDLPGFGFSDRSDRPYRIALYVAAIHDMLDEIAEDAGSGAIDAIALSLASEFLARVAAERPHAFRTLAFVTPTGFQRGTATRGGDGRETREVSGLFNTLNVPLWSRGLYNLLVTRPSIRFFLEKTWGSKRIDENLLDYDYLTTHQPGAEHAPYAFVSGRLFTANIRSIYERLAGPILVVHGTKGDFQDFSEAGWAEARWNWHFVALDTGALPHFEKLPDVLDAYHGFLDSNAAPQGSSSPSRSPSP